jgi:hypothetical protein
VALQVRSGLAFNNGDNIMSRNDFIKETFCDAIGISRFSTIFDVETFDNLPFKVTVQNTCHDQFSEDLNCVMKNAPKVIYQHELLN